MLRLGPTTAYTLIVLVMLTGCSGEDKKQPPAPDIKLGDLAPINPIGPVRPIQTVAFNFYTIELPAESIDLLSDIWPMLYTKHVRLTDPVAFAANSFQLVFGEPQMWQKTAALLESAGGRPVASVRLLLDYGQTGDFVVTRIREKTNVFYLTSDLSIESLTAPHDRLVLRVRASPVAGVRGLCDFNAMPVLIPAKSRTFLEDSTKMEDAALETLGFTVEMNSGDFFLMGPANYPSSVNSLSNLSFTAEEGRKIRVYAVFCSNITD
jgi:hypothetical protein